MSLYFNTETIRKIASCIGSGYAEVHKAVLDSGMLNLAAQTGCGGVEAPVKVFEKSQKGCCAIELADSTRFNVKLFRGKILFTKERSPFSIKIAKKPAQLQKMLNIA